MTQGLGGAEKFSTRPTSQKFYQISNFFKSSFVELRTFQHTHVYMIMFWVFTIYQHTCKICNHYERSCIFNSCVSAIEKERFFNSGQKWRATKDPPHTHMLVPEPSLTSHFFTSSLHSFPIPLSLSSLENGLIRTEYVVTPKMRGSEDKSVPKFQGLHPETTKKERKKALRK